MWIQKYKPKKLDEIIGNRTVVDSLKTFNWKKPLLLHGAIGVGKSALIDAIANEMNFDVVEIGDENIEQASSIAETSSLYGTRKLVVIDDVENISDIKKVGEFLKSTKNPTILIATDSKSKRLKTVKAMCLELPLRRPQAATIANYLEVICKKEKVNAEKSVLLKIAEKSQGDMRVALTDLETLAKGKDHIAEKDLEIVYQRDVHGDIYKTLGIVFNSKDLNEVISSTYDLDEQPGNTIFWIEENTPNLIEGPKEISNAFNYLSRADMFLGRIMKRQYWGFLRYANALMTAGVNVSKEKVRHAMYKFPSYFMKMGSSKGDRNTSKEISKKLSGKVHASSKAIIREDIPLFRILLKNNKIDDATLKAEYLLTDDEIEYLKEPV